MKLYAKDELTHGKFQGKTVLVSIKTRKLLQIDGKVCFLANLLEDHRLHAKYDEYCSEFPEVEEPMSFLDWKNKTVETSDDEFVQGFIKFEEVETPTLNAKAEEYAKMFEEAAAVGKQREVKEKLIKYRPLIEWVDADEIVVNDTAKSEASIVPSWLPAIDTEQLINLIVKVG